MKKNKMIVITRPQSGGYTVGDNIIDEMMEECKMLLEEGDDGESITFEVLYMTDEELKELKAGPEFMGW